MKRGICLLITLCLLGSAACAEGVLRVSSAWFADERYQELHPEAKLKVFTYEDDVDELFRTGEWDALCLSTDAYSLSELYEKGYLLDLGTVPEAAALSEGLYPTIRAGCSAGDTLVALPAGYIGLQTCGYRLMGTDHNGEPDEEQLALRERLGFTEADQPTNFAQVCELGVRYMALSRETRKGTTFLWSDDTKPGYILLYNMIRAYLCEATQEDGTVSFDTPEFRKALADARPLLDAFEADPKRTYDENGRIRTVLNEAVGLTGYGAFPYATEDDSIPAFMDVVVVNPKSPNLEQAIDYALCASQVTGSMALQLYASADYDEQLALSYDRNIAAQIEQGEDASVIETLEKLKAEGDESRFVPRKTIERYREEVMPNLVFRRCAMEKEGIATRVLSDYLQGEMTDDELIAALNGN